uniref:40S ribosomal protein S30 n=1 Tax=Physcomitrium patens TaxID=3218 RepID=A0A7I4C5J4_PHYPA
MVVLGVSGGIQGTAASYEGPLSLESALLALTHPLCRCLHALSSFTMSKVHGSLARAGKVRGQTPKVAKQDKKKKPKGRAHKRMQYNRRFVTAGDCWIRQEEGSQFI